MRRADRDFRHHPEASEDFLILLPNGKPGRCCASVTASFILLPSQSPRRSPKSSARAIVTRPRLAYERLVTASAALDQQIERYRQMTGEERLSIALGLHEMSCDIAREGIRHGNPGADHAEVERLLHRRLELARAG